MTEAEWTDQNDVHQMQQFIIARTSERKRRLFACACCRAIWDLLDDDNSRTAVEAAEKFADLIASEADLAGFREACDLLDGGFPLLRQFVNLTCGDAASCDAVAESARYHALYYRENAGLDAEGRSELHRFLTNAWGDAAFDSDLQQAALMRDIFGNPFRRVTLDPRWLTSTVVDLAKFIYDEPAFDRLPILADALMDAGCDDEKIIQHCRSNGEHVRGCWAVDLLLRKE